MLDEQISHCFSEIEGLIKLQLQNEIRLDINQKFKDVKELIDDLEVDDEEQYRFCISCHYGDVLGRVRRGCQVIGAGW